MPHEKAIDTLEPLQAFARDAVGEGPRVLDERQIVVAALRELARDAPEQVRVLASGNLFVERADAPEDAPVNHHRRRTEQVLTAE